jgi:hypothetical protein
MFIKWTFKQLGWYLNFSAWFVKNVSIIWTGKCEYYLNRNMWVLFEQENVSIIWTGKCEYYLNKKMWVLFEQENVSIIWTGKDQIVQ